MGFTCLPADEHAAAHSIVLKCKSRLRNRQDRLVNHAVPGFTLTASHSSIVAGRLGTEFDMYEVVYR